MGMIKPERDSRLDELITKEEAVNAIEQAFNEAVKGLDMSSPVYGLLDAVTGISKCHIMLLSHAQEENVP